MATRGKQGNVSGPWAVIASDSSGRIVGWNAAAEDLFCLTRRNVLGHRCDEILQGKDIFGNRFCKEDCSLLVMGKAGQALNDFMMTVRDADGDSWRAEISALKISVGDPPQDVVIHVIKSATKVMTPGA